MFSRQDNLCPSRDMNGVHVLPEVLPHELICSVASTDIHLSCARACHCTVAWCRCPVAPQKLYYSKAAPRRIVLCCAWTSRRHTLGTCALFQRYVSDTYCGCKRFGDGDFQLCCDGNSGRSAPKRHAMNPYRGSGDKASHMLEMSQCNSRNGEHFHRLVPNLHQKLTTSRMT